ncbi:serine O-acetyltransferase [Anaerosacchariphilus polymeriproducens]|uniref:Serine acetyltransferase n=1 Tax=Anaerosacchariphilus polymeriproducens TaxID=1812858 RepID=A0A371AUN9_9FIRM|nr:serine acetyltransferase [Anaerosacchariphilus polymeriproducens]RDU23286.1 serine acetyltransferase [Anaerosacchariphilus polymeriproducens]
MIQSKQDYLEYLEEDRIALGEKGKKPKLFGDEVWKFQRLLRKYEYYSNCKKGLISKIFCKYLQARFHYSSIRLGFNIPINSCDPGLSIGHIGPIIINGSCKIGRNCRIHVGTNIGSQAGKRDACPTIGDYCYIGPGVKIFGKISIGNHVAIGANAVVTKDFPDNVTIAGAPAKIINEKGSHGLLNYHEYHQ